MKLASFSVGERADFGVVTAEGVISMNARLGGKAADLKEALGRNLLPQIAEVAAKAKPDHKLADITFLPTIPNPELIACAGINYRSHASETGRDILARQKEHGWGAKVIDRLAADLRREFPGMEGFSPRNLKSMRAFAQAWPGGAIVQQAAAQIPRFHNCVLLDKVKDRSEREWYVQVIKL